MNRTAIWTIAVKDMKSIFSNFQIWGAMIILPFVFAAILPAVAILAVKSLDFATAGFNGSDQLVEVVQGIVASGDASAIAAMPSLNHQVVYLLVNYMFSPFFLLMAGINATTIGSNSFVGEKERRTLESLLFAPIDVKSLFVGKILSAFLPTIVILLASFVLFAGVVTALTWGMFDGFILTNSSMYVLMLWVVPTITICTILFTVLVSARVKDFRAAQQLSGLIVLPIVGLIVSQMTGLMLLNATVLFIIGLVLLVLSLVLLQRITKMNQRHVLFEKQVH